MDVVVQKHLYQPGDSSGWYPKKNPFTQFGYRYGSWRGALLSFAALVGLVWSWVRPGIERHRRHFLLILLTLVIGPGLIANVIFKDL